MKTGTLKKWHAERGFGFIARDDGAPDVFVHVTEIRSGRVNEGDTVQFDIGKSERNGRTVAARVTVLARGSASE